MNSKKTLDGNKKLEKLLYSQSKAIRYKTNKIWRKIWIISTQLIWNKKKKKSKHCAPKPTIEILKNNAYKIII